MKTERYEGMKQAKTRAKGEVENLAKRKVKGGKQGERERGGRQEYKAGRLEGKC